MKSNRTYSRYILLIITWSLVSAFICGSAYAKQARIALVIGNGDYKTAPLANPVNDAEDMAAVLKSNGFDVTLKTNAKMRAMDEAINAFGRKLRDGGDGLFYYAGHGIQVGGNNYLIPIGAAIESESDVKYKAINAGIILGKMEDAGNNLNIVILDACRNNPFARSFRSAEKGLARMDAPKGSLVAYATAPGSIAADGDGRNGIYTKHLIENIKRPGVKIEDVLKNVRVAVVKETGERQVPWESSSLMGNFYINTGGGDVNIALPPAGNVALPPSTDRVVDLDQRIREREAAQQKWSVWQKNMVDDYAKVERYDSSDALSAEEKASAWSNFLIQYNADNPHASQDESMRSNGRKRKAYWQDQKLTTAQRLKKKRLAAEQAELKRKHLELEKVPSGTKVVANDGQFIKYDNDTVKDTKTGLMWAARDNGSNINWKNAKRYCENYRGGEYSDWRMPTQDELAGLYKAGVRKNNHMIKITKWWVWALETRGSGAARFRFDRGRRYWPAQSSSRGNRALPVRAGN